MSSPAARAGRCDAAASAQDAINSWVSRRNPGSDTIVFPNGFGFVATGIGIYEIHENPVATRISQRQAYVRAFADARARLATKLYGVLSSGNETTFERFNEINESMGQSLVNIDTITTENIQQRVDGFLRGFVVYDVYDDASSRVLVTIVTTPRTQGHFDRPDLSTISAASIQEGLTQVFTEIQNGLVPPVGGMTVFVPATNELAFVGFGSAVIGRHNNAAMQARLELNSERIAGVRARDSLVGLIIGEQITQSEALDSEIISMVRDFEELASDDPAVRENPNHPGFVRLQDGLSSFRSSLVHQTTITSARQGVLPPGIRNQSWMDEDMAFAYAVSVFIPSATEAAAAGAESMRTGTIIQAPADQAQPPAVEQPQVPAAQPEVIRQGPTGTVQSIDGL